MEAINHTAPEANARPARAINLKRAYDLLRTDQFQFALLSTPNADAMRYAMGAFAGNPPVDLKTIYGFGNLEFAVRADFTAELVAVVTHAVFRASVLFRARRLHQRSSDVKRCIRAQASPSGRMRHNNPEGRIGTADRSRVPARRRWPRRGRCRAVKNEMSETNSFEVVEALLPEKVAAALKAAAWDQAFRRAWFADTHGEDLAHPLSA